MKPCLPCHYARPAIWLWRINGITHDLVNVPVPILGLPSYPYDPDDDDDAPAQVVMPMFSGSLFRRVDLVGMPELDQDSDQGDLDSDQD